jgi:hypothetical protein
VAARSKEFGVQIKESYETGIPLKLELAPPEIYISVKRNYILVSRESDMPILVKIDKTTKLISSEGALIQVKLSKEGAFLIEENE